MAKKEASFVLLLLLYLLLPKLIMEPPLTVRKESNLEKRTAQAEIKESIKR